MPEINEIVFSYTDKCNIECRHCLVDASPRNNQKIDLEKAKNVLKDAKLFPSVKRVSFTGGESLLFINEIGELISIAKEMGLATAVVSNGSWATTPEQAEKIVLRLLESGLDELVISLSQWHLEFVSENKVDLIVAATKKLSLPLTFFICKANDSDEVANRLRIKYSSLGIQIQEQYVVPYGDRPQKLMGEHELHYETIEQMDKRRCWNVLGPMVTPNGDVYFCCSGDFYKNKPYSAHRHGNVNKQSFNEIVSNKNQRLVDLIHYWGPKGLYDIAKDDLEKAGFKPSEKYYGDCSLCQQLLGNEKWTKIILQNSSKIENMNSLEAAKMLDAFKSKGSMVKTDF